MLLALLLAGGAASAAEAQVGSCAPARTARVLSGGGAKGLVHLGLLPAMDSLGIVPDLIVGTSIGAVVGALYASGESGTSIAARLRALPFDEAISSYEPIVSSSLAGLRPVMVLERERSGWVLQTGTARESVVSALVSRFLLRANLMARGDFDSLPIPFRAVAADLDDRSIVVLARGDLARAIRASIALPLILRPVVIDGRALVDGALASNRPVGVARRLGAERVIVSTAETPRRDASSSDDPLTVTGALFKYLWVQDTFSLGVHDIHVASQVGAFNQLDFRPQTIDSLVAVGRRTADVALAAKCVATLSPTRRVVQEPTIIGQAAIATTELPDRGALLGAVAIDPTRPLDAAQIAEGLSRVAQVERYRGVWLNPTGSGARVNFDLTTDPAPRRSFGFGVAFDHTMSGRLWLGGADRALFGADIAGTALLTAGTYRSDLTLAARRPARIGARDIPLGGSLELISESVRLYQNSGELSPAEVVELDMLLGVRPLFEPGWSYELGADYRLWREPGLATRGTAGLRLALHLRRASAPAPIITAEVIALSAWHRAALDVSRSIRLGSLEIRPRVRAGWGEDLPIHQTFALGGLDGFAGLRMQERRGSQEAFASLLFRHAVWGRILGRFEPMIGAIGNGTGFLERRGAPDGEMLAGFRVGLEVGTPIGPIRVEQGFNNLNRRETLIRVGHWF